MINNNKHIILTLLISLTFILSSIGYTVTKDDCESNITSDICDCIYEYNENHNENHNVFEDANCGFTQAFEVNNSIVLYNNNKELSKRENNYKVLTYISGFEYEEIIIKNILTLFQNNYQLPQRDIPILNSSFLI